MIASFIIFLILRDGKVTHPTSAQWDSMTTEEPTEYRADALPGGKSSACAIESLE